MQKVQSVSTRAGLGDPGKKTNLNVPHSIDTGIVKPRTTGLLNSNFYKTPINNPGLAQVAAISKAQK